MTDTSLTAPDAFAALRALRGLDEDAARQKNIRRTVTSAAVIAVHVALVALLLISLHMPEARHVKLPVEITLLLPTLQKPAPIVSLKAPPQLRQPERVLQPTIAPITITPAPAEKAPQGDIMRALGVAIACGASHYEYLSPAEKRICKHPPWTQPPDRNLAILPPPPPLPGHMTGAEAATRERETAAPCPMVMNTPCIDKVIWGNAPH